MVFTAENFANNATTSNTIITPYSKVHPSDEEFCSSTITSSKSSNNNDSCTSASAAPRCISSGTNNNNDDGNSDGGGTSCGSDANSNSNGDRVAVVGTADGVVGKRRQNNPYACGNLFGPSHTTSTASLSHQTQGGSGTGKVPPTPHTHSSSSTSPWLGEDNNNTNVQSLNSTCNSAVSGLQQQQHCSNSYSSSSQQLHGMGFSNSSTQIGGWNNSGYSDYDYGIISQQQQSSQSADYSNIPQHQSCHQTMMTMNASSSSPALMNAASVSVLPSASSVSVPPYNAADANQQMMFEQLPSNSPQLNVNSDYVSPCSDPNYYTRSTTQPASSSQVQDQWVGTHPSQHKRKAGDASTMTPPQQQQEQQEMTMTQFTGTGENTSSPHTQHQQFSYDDGDGNYNYSNASHHPQQLQHSRYQQRQRYNHQSQNHNHNIHHGGHRSHHYHHTHSGHGDLPPHAMNHKPTSVSSSYVSLNKQKKTSSNKRSKIPQHEKTMYLHLVNMRAQYTQQTAAAEAAAAAGDQLSEESVVVNRKSTVCVSYFPWPTPQEVKAMNGNNVTNNKVMNADGGSNVGGDGGDLVKANLFQLPIQINLSAEMVAWLFIKFGGVDVVHVSTSYQRCEDALGRGGASSTSTPNPNPAMQPQSFRVVFLESVEALRKAQVLMDQRLLIDHNGVWYAANRAEHSLMMAYLNSSPRYVPKKPVMLEPLSHNQRQGLDMDDDVTTFMRPSTEFVSDEAQQNSE